MAETIPKRSSNFQQVASAETNDAGRNVKPLLVDPSTGRLLVDASVTVSGLATAVTDGEAVDAADVGNLSMGTDGSNYQIIHTDSSGDLQIDVLTMPTTTVQATNLDIRDLVNTDVVTAELSAVDNAVLDTIAAKDFATQTTLAAINTKLASGTVIGDVNLGATDNAVLDAIAASVAAIDTDTTTIIGHVDGIEGQLTTIDGRVDGLETSNTAIQTAVQIMDDWDNGASDGASVSGDVAHDTADAGEPVKIGGKALNLGANPTGVTANDRVNGMFTRAGQQITLGGHVNIITKNLNVTDADGAQTNADVLGAIGSNVSVVVTKVSVMADGANTGDVAVRLGFGTASVPAVDSAGILFAHPGIKPGSGVVEGNGAGILGIGASGEELRVTCEDPAGGAIDITISYFTIEI